MTIGLDFRIIQTKSELRKLDISECASEFYHSSKCVIFIDHEALPIVEYAKNNMQPLKCVLDDIEEISLDHRNTIIIYSQ
jgi:hypothetical protein